MPHHSRCPRNGGRRYWRDFPQQDGFGTPVLMGVPAELCTVEEMSDALGRMKTEKAPDPDTVPPEAVRIAGRLEEEWLLCVFNKLPA